MSRRADRCALRVRLLPPLLVLAFAAVLAARVAARPSRAPRQSHIASLVLGGNQPDARRALDRYQRDYADEDDRWFVAEMHMRLGELGHATDAVRQDLEGARQTEAVRRFAIVALSALGWEDRHRAQPTPDMPACLLALVEGRVPWADQILRHLAATDSMVEASGYFFRAFRDTTPRPLSIIVEAFRKRSEEPFQIAAAMASARNEAWRQPGDLAKLRKVVGAEGWRLQQPQVWRSCCYTLGQTRDPEGLTILRERLEALSKAEGPNVADDVAFLRIGLFVSGDWSQHDPLFERVLHAATFDPTIAMWASDALLHLHHQGDPEARHIIGDVWALPGKDHPGLRHSIARSILLRESAPDESAVPIALVLKTLQAPGAPLMSHMLARAYLLRRQQPDGLKAVLDGLRQAAQLLKVEGADPAVLHDAARAGLRAMLLFGGAPQPR